MKFKLFQDLVGDKFLLFVDFRLEIVVISLYLPFLPINDSEIMAFRLIQVCKVSNLFLIQIVFIKVLLINKNESEEIKIIIDS